MVDVTMDPVVLPTLKRDKLAWMREEMAELDQQGLSLNIRTIQSPQGAWLTVDGRRVLNFCSNNYLGLADDPRLIQAAVEGAQKYGVGPAAVRSIAGTLDLHLRLEQRLAEFKGAEACIVLQSGFNANGAVIPTLVGKDDAIFSDELNHASIIDGARLSRAKIIPYPHNDMGALYNLLCDDANCHFRRRLIISDGVFSMDGDITPLGDLANLAETNECLLMVDDAHGEGVLGRGGRGIVDHFGLHGRVDVEIGTLSKAFGVVGGLVAGSKTLIDYLRQKARPFLFSSAMTAADTAACLAAVDILAASDELVQRLWSNSRHFKAKMVDLGFDVGHSQTPITPVILGEAPLAKQFSKRLFEEGVFAVAIGFPTVARGKARIRVMVSAAHSEEDLNVGLDAFARVGRELGIIK